GVQYISIMVGWGGSFPLTGGNVAGAVAPGRLLTFALNGKEHVIWSMQQVEVPPPSDLEPIAFNASKETIAQGAGIFAQYCSVCHGIAASGGGGVLPDLKYSDPAIFDKYQQIVIEGALAESGMPSFKSALGPEEVQAIRAYILSLRNSMKR